MFEDMARQRDSVGILRLDVDGSWSVSDFILLANRIQVSYNRLNAFASPPDSLQPFLRDHSHHVPDQEIESFFEAIVESSLRLSLNLRILRIRLESPGLLEFLGALNPLKVIADIIIAWRRENTIRDQLRHQMNIEYYKMIIERERNLLEFGSPELVQRWIQHAFDQPKDLLAEVARDTRIREASWREFP